MKIGLIVERCQIEEPGALLAQVAQLLSEWGVVVKPIIPEASYARLAYIQPAADLYLLTSSTPLALNLAGILHTLGAALLNPYPVVNALHNKLIGLRILQAHGVPIPETYITTNPAQLKDLLAVSPLLIKPLNAPQPDAGQPTEYLVYTMRELQTVVAPHSPVMAQRAFEPAAQPWLIGCIGGQLSGIDHRQAGHRTLRDPLTLSSLPANWAASFSGRHRHPAPVEPTASRRDDLAELALRCGQIFDIDLFGLKVVEHQGTLYLLDMVSFPAWQTEPETALRLAEYLFARTQFLLQKKREHWQTGNDIGCKTTEAHKFTRGSHYVSRDHTKQYPTPRSVSR